MNDSTVRVRFAPSPTGFLHVGGLRTALFNFLFAKKYGGKFILRIEDTDRKRLVEGSEQDIKDNLKSFGLNWDEEYKQSDRLGRYKELAEKLVAEDKAYYEESEKGKAVRFKVETEGTTEFEDLVHGKLSFKNETFKDPIILKSDGYPVYNFANVVDDHDMQITHVIRGEEFLPSTPIHIQIYESLGWEIPKFVHLPLILDQERKKLSKRSGDVAVREYIEKGYLPQALLNFIALLGWNPKTEQEIFSLDELIAEFAVEKINKAGPIFDVVKLDFINREWQRKLNLKKGDPLNQKAFEILEKKFGEINQKFFEAVRPLITERIKGPSDLEKKLPEFYFFFNEPEYDAKLLIWKDTSNEKIKNNLNIMMEFLKTLSFNSSPLSKGEEGRGIDLQSKILGLLEERGIGKGEALWPLRVALAGLQNSPGPFEVMEAFSKMPGGQKIILARIQKAIEKLT